MPLLGDDGDVPQRACQHGGAERLLCRRVMPQERQHLLPEPSSRFHHKGHEHRSQCSKFSSKIAENFAIFSPNFAQDQDQEQVSWNREKVFENSPEGEDVARFSISHASTISPVIGIRSFSVRSLFSSAASPVFSGTPLSRL